MFIMPLISIEDQFGSQANRKLIGIDYAHSTKVERGVINENDLTSVLDTLKCIMKGLQVIFPFLNVFDRKISI